MATVKQIFTDFIVNFSSHGLKRVFYPVGQRPKLASYLYRFIWLFAWGTAAFFMTGQIMRHMNTYFQYKTVTSVSIQRGDPILFPVVTVCPFPRFSVKRVIECLKNESVSPFADLCAKYEKNFWGVDWNKKEAAKSAAIEMMTIISSDFAPVNQTYFNQTLDDLMPRSHFRFDEQYFNKEFFTPYDVNNIRRCFSFGKVQFENGTSMSQTKPSGFLDVRLSELEGCYFILIHAPDAVPMFSMQNDIMICDSTKITFESETRNLLPQPHGNCISDWDEDHELKPILDCYPELRRYPYSADACRAFRFGNPSILFRPQIVSCNGPQQEPQVCPDQCHQTVYKMTTSIVTIDPHYPMWKSEQDTELLLLIGNPNLEAQNTTEMPAIDPDQLIGNIGGLFGLWLGASILTVVEVLEFIFSIFQLLLSRAGNAFRINTVDSLDKRFHGMN